MVYLALLVLPFLRLSASATPAGLVTKRVASTSARSAAAIAPHIPVAEYVLPLAAKAPRPGYKKAAMDTLRGRSQQGSSSVPTAVLAGSDFDEEYLTNITVGGQKFTVIVDTGRLVKNVYVIIKS
eukprot:GHVU01003330.1.p1 GENE.GHVU01003330.1~~GHVU01003330.1.p1  ORF type:complete len:125 (+),score=5.83 GHVU01003330.1:129-503(+)